MAKKDKKSLQETQTGVKKGIGTVAENSEMSQADEELFKALQRNKKRKRKKRIIIIVIVVLLLAGGVFAAMKILQKKVRTEFATEVEEVSSAQAETGSVSTVVSGSGMLKNADTQTVTVPDDIEVTDILVSYGDSVEEGDLIATVDMATVRSAMASIQEEIDALDEEIADAMSDSVSAYIQSGVSGRVKVIYAGQGDTLEDVMVGKGSLALISLDGYMAVDIESTDVSEGDKLTVTLSDGSAVSGSVKSVSQLGAVVLVSDNGPAFDDEVTVSTADGTVLGSGKLYIHNSLAITGYAGTIKYVNVSLNQKVYSGSTLFTLTDTSTSAVYNALLRERGELEESLLELLKIQQYGGIITPISGGVYSVTSLGDSTAVTSIATISPDENMTVTISVDEADILSLEPGQKATVTVNSIGDDAITGEVTAIDKTYSNSTYTAEITIPKMEGMIAGMTASVQVIIEGVEGAVYIPVEALNQTSSGYYVYTGYDEETGEFTSQKDVVPGLSNSDYVEIKSGLSEGETVYYKETQSMADMFGMSMGGGFSGDMTGGGDMPSGGFGGGDMPSGGGKTSGGDKPSGGGGDMPSGGGGSMPGGFGG